MARGLGAHHQGTNKNSKVNFVVGLYYFALTVYDFYDLISFFPFLSLCLLFFTSFGFDLDSIV